MCADNNVYISRCGKLIRHLAFGVKAVSVPNYKTNNMIHIFCYFGESDNVFLTRYGIMLTKQEFIDLVILNSVILTEYKRLKAQSPEKYIFNWVGYYYNGCAC